MKAMQVSLHHFTDQVKRLQSEYEDITGEFKGIREAYFEHRKTEERRALDQQKIQAMMRQNLGEDETAAADQQPYKGHKVAPLQKPGQAAAPDPTTDAADPFSYKPPEIASPSSAQPEIAISDPSSPQRGPVPPPELPSPESEEVQSDE
eukprot:TRINITY_DN757_c1_g2_i1.p1 TRINITY_DN757_c1_g2~~TRINITY_DN757_c1_g2_i1.p1  ORF type:complete len:149 (+),score=40.80 TRINITY_DN757_c1_g2_i1:51-497(+)